MNPARFIHVAATSRLPREADPTTGKMTHDYVPYLPSVRGLAEAATSRSRASQLGTANQATYQWSWGLDDIQEGDQLNFLNKSFIVTNVIRDTTRPNKPYQTCLLVEKI